MIFRLVPHQTIHVFIGATPPGGISMSKGEIYLNFPGNALLFSKLLPAAEDEQLLNKLLLLLLVYYQ